MRIKKETKEAFDISSFLHKHIYESMSSTYLFLYVSLSGGGVKILTLGILNFRMT